MTAAPVADPTGIANENVEPRPSSDSTQIRPPWPSTMWRAIDRPRPGPAAAHPGPVGLVEPLEDPRSVGLRDADPVIDDRGDDLVTAPSHLDPDLAAVGAELDRVVDEVDEHLAEARLVAAHGRQAGRDVDDQRDARCGRRTGGGARSSSPPATRGRRRPRARAGRRPRSARGRAARSTIWTRWPVSTSIFVIRSRIRPGTSVVSASRARVSASRLTLLSGVRSSWLRLSMNSDRICWRRRSSVASSSTTSRPAGVGPMDADDEDARLAVPDLDLAGRRAADRHPVDQALGAGVEERLHHGPADEPARLDVEEGVRALVRVVDPAVRVEVEDADGQQLLERPVDGPRRGRLGAAPAVACGAARLASWRCRASSLVGASSNDVQRRDERERQPDHRDHEHARPCPEDRIREDRRASAPNRPISSSRRRRSSRPRRSGGRAAPRGR